MQENKNKYYDIVLLEEIRDLLKEKNPELQAETGNKKIS